MPHRVRIAESKRAYSLSVMTPCSSSRFVQYWNFRYFTMAIFSGCFIWHLLVLETINPPGNRAVPTYGWGFTMNRIA